MNHKTNSPSETMVDKTNKKTLKMVNAYFGPQASDEDVVKLDVDFNYLK